MNAARFINVSSFTSANRQQSAEPKPMPGKPLVGESYSKAPCMHCGSHWRKGEECSECLKAWRTK